MSDKELKDKAIDLKGKKYVLVKDRILFFSEEFPNGKIETRLVGTPLDKYVVKATVTPDVETPERKFTGLSAESLNTEAALEKAETSAVGRALAMMGIGVIESIASADEMARINNNGSDPDF